MDRKLVIMTAILITVIITPASTLVPARVAGGDPTSTCNSNDHAIYSLRGTKFPELFRPLGGPFTSKAKFEMGVMELTGLSHTCAQCYGDSYICGYSHCKWDCSSAGSSCDACLLDNECTQKCAQCTGFK